jgi:hypothetical protein
MRFLTTMLFLIAAPSAFAQLDSFTLHSKYGPPLERESRCGPESKWSWTMGQAKQVCRIQLPSGTRYGGTIPDGAVTKKHMEEVLDEVVPISLRGKEVNKMEQIMGLLSVSMTIYEHVTIAESKNGSIGTGITVIFKDASCPNPTVR